jgi:hypothetical protein
MQRRSDVQYSGKPCQYQYQRRNRKADDDVLRWQLWRNRTRYAFLRILSI